MNTFHSIRRLIGRRFNNNVINEASRLSYNLLNSDGKIRIDCPNVSKQFAPEELLAQILKQLIDDASQHIGECVNRVMITAPTTFNVPQICTLKAACHIAGLQVGWIISDSGAAAIAYGLDKKSNETILVFDLGGGSLSISIAEVGDGVFEILSHSGDAHLGGDDFDQKIIDYLSEQFMSQNHIDLNKDKQALQRLTEAVEKAKIDLSSVNQVEINIPFITFAPDGPKHLNLTLTRAKFEELTSDLIERCQLPVEDAIRVAQLTKIDIDEVVLVGSATRIPAVQNLMATMFGKEPKQSIHPDEAVAIGAAIQGGVLNGDIKDILLLDATPLSLGVESLGGVMTKMIPRGTTIPTKTSKIFSTTMDDQSSIEIHVLQGECEMAEDNTTIGFFRIDGINPLPQGVPQIEVTFAIDASGILNVIAKDKFTGKKQSISITDLTLESQDVVEQMAAKADPSARIKLYDSSLNSVSQHQPIIEGLKNWSWDQGFKL